MEIITLTKENIEREHICCAISSNSDCQVVSKKAWLAERLDEGLMFKKGDVRGKCFIEYIPAEHAWAPIYAPGFMYIDCMWVAGQFKGHGYADMLLAECIRDSKEKGKRGLVTLSSKKKRSFLSDPGYLKHSGFAPVDSAIPYFELMALPFDADAELPRFREQVKQPPQIDAKGFTLFYTDQCPFNAKYVPIILDKAKERGVQFNAVHLTSAQQAQGAFSPFTTYSLYYDGEFLTHEQLSENKFEKLLAERGF